MFRHLVAFLHVGDDPSLPLLMIESVRRHMPGVGLVQMTNPSTPSLPGVDTRQEMDYRGEGFMVYRLAHLASLAAEEAILLDTDVLLQGDLRHVFDDPFDVALTRRDDVILLKGRDITPEQPYNTGVMFSRSPAFWRAAGADCLTRSDSERRWFGDQLAIARVAAGGQFAVQELPCARYNYSPAEPDEDLSGRLVVHYKGKRKPWMAMHARHLGVAA